MGFFGLLDPIYGAEVMYYLVANDLPQSLWILDGIP